jgi:hypothetical protein
MRRMHITKLICTILVSAMTGCGGDNKPISTPPPLTITTASLLDGFVTFPYNQTIQATGGVPPYTWTVKSGTLPHNLILGSSSSNSVTISGTPDTAQSPASFTVVITDAKDQSAAQSYSISINSVATARLLEVPGQVPADTFEIQGLSAASFTPSYWQKNTLNWVADVRSPIFAPLSGGQYRNIYAPWPIEMQPGGWRMFYGGWDGTDTPYDQIDSVTTDDFLQFDNRDHVIANGAFLNVNNVNVQQLSDGSFHMICTAGQAGTDAPGKPAYFRSPDGTTWNGLPEPYSAQLTDIISIRGYDGFDAGNFNGANVLLRDGGTWALYFKDLNDIGTTYRATTDTPPEFQFQGSVLKSQDLVNDVKKLMVNGQDWYVMGLVGADDKQSVFISLSNDGRTFDAERVLFKNDSAQDRYIVALGFVMKGTRLLGALYGAGPVESLDQNQIFARWLQKKVLVTDSTNVQYTSDGGYGPDRQWFQVSSSPITGTLLVYAEDGVTPMASGTISITPGKAYLLVLGVDQ